LKENRVPTVAGGSRKGRGGNGHLCEQRGGRREKERREREREEEEEERK
jgi:hypothetical protein